MTTLTFECRSFTATPLEDGKMRLEIAGAIQKAKDADASYGAEGAMARLSELLNRSVSRSKLAYWRDHLGLPYRRLGLKKFVYREGDLIKWARGQTGVLTE